jgi:hypothetical protein
MVEDILIEEEAAKRGITVSDEEVALAMQEAFEFYPEGTPTPTITPTIVNTPTLSLSQIAIIQPTDTPTPLPTATSTPDGWVPTNTATPTLEPQRPRNQFLLAQPQPAFQLKPKCLPSRPHPRFSQPRFMAACSRIITRM